MKKIYSHIKKAALMGLLGLVGMAQTGCSDFLETEPLNDIILENFWTEKLDVTNAIAGCYSAMQDEGVIRRMMVWGEFRSENVYVGSDINKDQDLEKVLKENIDAKNAYTTWSGFYNVINRCNTVLKYAPQVAAKDAAYIQSDLNANIAEMVALRSLSYFYLIRAFRDVPYSTVAYTDDDQEMDLPATKFEVVLDSLIADLESVKDMAVKAYPSTTPLYQTGRITKDAIHAMLCEMYLWKQDYQKCIEYADLVIEAKKQIAENNRRLLSATAGGSSSSDRYNGYPLLSEQSRGSEFGDAYSKLFGSDKSYQYYNQEIIFQLIFDDDPQKNSKPANGAVNTFYGNATDRIGLVAPSDFFLDDVNKVYASQNKRMDARIYENCNMTNNSINKFTTPSLTINATSSSAITCGYDPRYTKDQNGSNWIIYRLTDIMLLKAEALTQLMQTGTDASASDYNNSLLAQAFSLVNAVNKRALCQTQLTDTLQAGSYSSKSQMETLVYQERQRELMFEGKRWFDLVRIARRENSTTTLSSAAMMKHKSGASLIANRLKKMDAIYWPYNLEELKVNTNLVQNPAFSSGENDSYAKNY
ncbi:MAG: RagB/SusD family nutrient uptake outer membrane protein [Prevotella sp.]|nr:RagB/SusD family nutrient uptake outer membrane protein [Prevotella sp.]